MTEYFYQIGYQIPLILFLMALLGLYRRVTPKAYVRIKAPIDKVFSLIDLYDGKSQNWHNTQITSRLIDAPRQLYEVTYVNTLQSGSQQTRTALFQITKREAPHYLVMERQGLEGKSHRSELLKMTQQLTQENNQTKLHQTYHWGPRPLLAQLMARADLWGGIYRLKSLAETGRPSERAYTLISLSISAITAVITLAAFALMLGWLLAFILVIALFFHELGHMLAYRLIGQPWGRMVFLPFLGAIAVPRLAFESQGQVIFAALMGPGFSLLLTMGLFALHYLAIGPAPLILISAGIVCLLNLFNLLPAEPLDGGIALRSIFNRLLGNLANYGLLLVGAIIVVVGMAIGQILIVIFGVLAVLANLRPRVIDRGLKPLTRLQVIASVCAYGLIVSDYMALTAYVWAHLELQMLAAP